MAVFAGVLGQLLTFGPVGLRAMRLLALALAALANACLYQGEATAFDPSEARGELSVLPGVPLVLQRGRLDCGPAALSSVLAYWGVARSPEAIRRTIGTPPDRSLGAGALRDYARAQGLEAFVFQGSFADLEREIAAGRPVIVGTLKPYVGDRWYAHYEVVAGIGPSSVVTMDPADGYRRYPRPGFLAEWERSRCLTLALARPAPATDAGSQSAAQHYCHGHWHECYTRSPSNRKSSSTTTSRPMPPLG